MNLRKFQRQEIERQFNEIQRKYEEISFANQLLVIDCLMDGYSNRETAAALNISTSTVKKYIGRIAKRFGISAEHYDVRVRIVYLVAVERGLIKPYETTQSNLDSVHILRTHGLRYDAPSSDRNQVDDHQPWVRSGSSNGAGNTRRALSTHSVV